MSSLVVTGSIGIDTVHTPTGSASNVLGGSCTYFSAAAGFFSPVRIVAAVGDDFDHRYLEILKSFNVDLAGLEIRTGSRTFRWTGRYLDDINQRETVEVHVGVLGENPPPVPPSFRDSRFVFLANTHPAAQLAFLDALPQHHLAVADTMDLWIRTERALLEKLLSRVDGLVLNYSEAEQLSGALNPVAAARRIREHHKLQFVIVKKGEHGSLLSHALGTAVLPAFPVENVVDPTGAGDSFAGGLMGCLAHADRTDFDSLRIALSYGTVISSFTVESFSLDRLRRLTLPEIKNRLADFARAVRVL